MDIRYSFLNTLDHFPSELIRTLWVIQSLDMERDQIKNKGKEYCERNDEIAQHMLSQAEFLERLVDERITVLNQHKDELIQLQDIRKRYESIMKKHDSTCATQLEVKEKLSKRSEAEQKKHSRLMIKVNLKKHREKTSISKQELAAIEYPTVPSVYINEPTYCICHDVSYGQMIACDSPRCPMEWFHYGCIGIIKTPVGKWYCSDECKKSFNKKETTIALPVSRKNETKLANNRKKKRRPKQFY